MEKNDKTDTGAQAIIDFARDNGEVDTIDLGGGAEVLSVPLGRRIESTKLYLDQFRKAPERKKGTAKLTSLDSFIDHVKRHKDDDTVLFAIESEPALLSVYDYNKGGPTGAPRFGEHRARYTFPLSDEWNAWKKAAAGPMNQAAFAEFLEDRIGDVMDPLKVGETITEFAVQLGVDVATPQKLMTLSRGLQVNVSAVVKNAVTLTSGEGEIQFGEEHKDSGGAPLRVPGCFAIAIPVFKLGAIYQVPVRLKYRREGGVISWFVTPNRTAVIFEDAFGEAANKAANETKLPLFYGTPEA